MKTKYTPGPWYFCGAVMRKDYLKGENVDVIAAIPTINEEAGPAICLISPESESTEIDRANAHLIAAAPELLDCLNKIIAIYESGYTLGPKMIIDIREVISKTEATE